MGLLVYLEYSYYFKSFLRTDKSLQENCASEKELFLTGSFLYPHPFLDSKNTRRYTVCMSKKKKIWFKAKKYGWGWQPITWEGWLTVIGYLAIATVLALQLNEGDSLLQVMSTFVVPMILLIFVLITLCYERGEKPKWSWGNK